MVRDIQIKNISKTFYKVNALSDVSFTIRAGTTHAVMGENGAGKSTLMKLLGGVHRPDAGQIMLGDTRCIFNNVKESINAGISVIYQELNILSELSVAENIFLSRLPSKLKTVVNDKELLRTTRELLERLNIPLNPRLLAGSLNVSEKQMIEIARAISCDSDIIIMDEPTSSLNTREVDRLFEIIESLKSQGRTIIYITHRMKELFQIADEVTVLRDGHYIDTRSVSDVTHDDVVRLMVGRKVENFYKSSDHIKNNLLLHVEGLSSAKAFRDISFMLKEGEIFGVAGLLGCGNVELARAIYGLHPISMGDIHFLGEHRKQISVNESLERGISFVTDDRKEAGIFRSMGVRHNVTITILKQIIQTVSRLLNLKKEREIFEDYTQKLKMVFSDENQPAENLSGGNQQKLLLGRALASGCRLLVLLEPTKGVDVGTKLEVYEFLRELTATGMGVFLVSSDLPELISLSNRIAVMCQGRLTGIVEGDEISEESVMKLATTE